MKVSPRLLVFQVLVRYQSRGLTSFLMCIDRWGHPPNFLLVDYYNDGSYPGSVFEVAARHNNVTYKRPCCGRNLAVSAAANAFANILLLATMSVSGTALLIGL